MGQRIHYAMQSFRRSASGALTLGRWRSCVSLEEATDLAERTVLSGRAIGAIALTERTSGDFEGASQPITIAAFGVVPEDRQADIPF